MGSTHTYLILLPHSRWAEHCGREQPVFDGTERGQGAEVPDRTDVALMRWSARRPRVARATEQSVDEQAGRTALARLASSCDQQVLLVRRTRRHSH